MLWKTRHQVCTTGPASASHNSTAANLEADMFVLVFSRRPCSPASSESHHNFLPNINTGVSHRMQPCWYFCNQVLWFLERTPWVSSSKGEGGLKRMCVDAPGAYGVRHCTEKKKSLTRWFVSYVMRRPSPPPVCSLAHTDTHTTTCWVLLY